MAGLDRRFKSRPGGKLTDCRGRGLGNFADILVRLHDALDSRNGELCPDINASCQIHRHSRHDRLSRVGRFGLRLNSISWRTEGIVGVLLRLSSLLASRSGHISVVCKRH